jgi:uncharacterized membrane protein
MHRLRLFPQSACIVSTILSTHTGSAFIGLRARRCERSARYPCPACLHMRFHPRRNFIPRNRPTIAFPLSRLHSTTISSPFLRASGSLVCSALFGTWIDRLIPNSGILSTLVLASLFSGFRVAPNSHFLYDLCWSTILPASLALLLLAMKSNTVSINSDIKAGAAPVQDTVLEVVKRMALPFTISSIGSLAGCILSFGLCCWKPDWSMPPEQAAVAASCLSASYIGGSVNFFATAAAILATNRPEKQVVVNTLVSAMAAADLILMAIYFVLMAAAQNSVGLRLWFGGAESPGPPLLNSTREEEEDKEAGRPLPLSMRLSASVLVSLLALLLVQLSSTVEAVLSGFVPGTACAFLSAATVALSRLVPPNLTLWNEMQNVAGPISAFFFFLLFAAIGMSADLEAALRRGPACIVFSGIALAIHCGIALVGSWLFKRFFSVPIQFDDVLIASNAAIGGPATAATFCGTLPNNSRALTVAATVWGVVGYSVGTTMGVGVYRILTLFIY